MLTPRARTHSERNLCFSPTHSNTIAATATAVCTDPFVTLTERIHILFNIATCLHNIYVISPFNIEFSQIFPSLQVYIIQIKCVSKFVYSVFSHYSLSIALSRKLNRTFCASSVQWALGLI